jgi:hypothetical protein
MIRCRGEQNEYLQKVRNERAQLWIVVIMSVSAAGWWKSSVEKTYTYLPLSVR